MWLCMNGPHWKRKKQKKGDDDHNDDSNDEILKATKPNNHITIATEWQFSRWNVI